MADFFRTARWAGAKCLTHWLHSKTTISQLADDIECGYKHATWACDEQGYPMAGPMPKPTRLGFLLLATWDFWVVAPAIIVRQSFCDHKGMRSGTNDPESGHEWLECDKCGLSASFYH